MTKLFKGLLLGGILALTWTGCSTDREPGDSSTTLYSADQITILQTAHLSPGKASMVDGALDFSLELDPENEVHWSTLSDPENEVHWNEVHWNHQVTVTVPAGAVTEPVVINGQWLASSEGGALGYEFGPEGLDFENEIRVSIVLPIEEQQIPSDEELLVLYDREDGWYEAVDNEVHWNTEGTGVVLNVGVGHFSKYLLGSGPPPDENPGEQ